MPPPRRSGQPPGSSASSGAPGAPLVLAVLAFFLAIAVSIDFPRTALGFKGDEATYYSLTYSIARDGDMAFKREDLVRVWEEFSAPKGYFSSAAVSSMWSGAAAFPSSASSGRPIPRQIDSISANPTSIRCSPHHSSGSSAPAAFSCFTACCSRCAWPPATAFSSRAARGPRQPRRSPRCSSSRRSRRFTSSG